MSLINEALKKVGRERAQLTVDPPRRAEAPQPAVPVPIREARAEPHGARGRRSSWGWLLATAALIAVACGSVAALKRTGERVVFFAGPWAFASTFNEVLPPHGLDPAAALPPQQGQMTLWGQVPAGVLTKGLLSRSAAPATRPEPPPGEPLGFRLSGTVAGTQTRSALINDRWVGVGEMVEGARVQTILAGEVILNYRGREFRLRVT